MWGLIALMALASGCRFDKSGLAPPDAARPDAALPDAGPDARTPDAGPDAQTPDSGQDAQTPDAGPDAQTPDSGQDAQTPACGNGLVEAGEACDGSDLGGSTCESLGSGGGVLACNVDCSFNLGGCWSCGNGVVDPAEQCDGLSLNGATCGTLGFTAGVLACASGCTFDTSLCSLCGNSALEPGEECDGTLLGGADCLSRGFDGGTLGCAASCQYDVSDCTLCGDNLAEPGEVCDGADLRGVTCTSLGYHSGTLECTSACLLDETGCAQCGDGALEGDEACDDGAANSDTVPDACRTDCSLPLCGDGVCDTPDRGFVCPADCTTVVLWEDFEGAWPGAWIANDNNDHWLTGKDYWGRVTSRYHSATRSLWCAENGGNIGGYDNNMDAYAIRAVDLSPFAGQTITLSLWIWVHTDSSNDWYGTMYSPDGTNWTFLETTSGNAEGWAQKTYSLSSQAGNASFVLGLYFHSNDIGSTNEGAYVDDIRITAVW